jgi:hypothetical protein
MASKHLAVGLEKKLFEGAFATQGPNNSPPKKDFLCPWPEMYPTRISIFFY